MPSNERVKETDDGKEESLLARFAIPISYLSRSRSSRFTISADAEDITL